MPYTYPASGTIIYSKTQAINSRDQELQSQDPRVVDYSGNNISLAGSGGKIAFFYTDGDQPDQESIRVYAILNGGRLTADETNKVEWTLENYKYTAANSSYPALDRDDTNLRQPYIDVYASRFINHGSPVTISATLFWQGVTYTTTTLFQITKVYRQPTIRVDRVSDLVTFNLDAGSNDQKYSQTLYSGSEYTVNVNENFVRLFHGLNGANEAAVSCGNFVIGIQYTIVTLGSTTNTQWNTIAGTVGVTYSTGSSFTAILSGSGLGNGTAKPVQGTPKQIPQSGTSSSDPDFIEYGPHYEGISVPSKNGLYLSVNKISGQIYLRSSFNGWTSTSERFTLTAKRHGVTYQTQYEIAKLTQQGIIDETRPPTPGWTTSAGNTVISATAGTTTILLTVNKTEFSYTTDFPATQPDGTPRRDTRILAGFNPSTSRHASIIIYGAKLSTPTQTATIDSYIDSNGVVTTTTTTKRIRDNILGQFGERSVFPSTPNTLSGITDQSVFSIPAESGNNYILFVAYVSKAGIIGPYSPQPLRIQMGEDTQKVVDALVGEITEAQLYRGLQERLSELDRGDKRIASKVSVLDDQYSVKIDAAGHVAGFGLSNTSRSAEENPVSDFGVVADRFWITAPAYVGSSAPAQTWHGRVWVDTSTAGDNQGLVSGVTVYYDTYKPDIHNSITMPNDSDLHYWQVTTETDINRLKAIVGGTTYTNRGTWAVNTSYSVNDYVKDEKNNVYYICLQAYTPVQLTGLATVRAGSVGYFTASGATTAVNKTVYIIGQETITPSTSGGGTNSTLKIGSSYNSLGTFYYITQVTGSDFQLSLIKSGTPITTGIQNNKKYWSNSASAWVSTTDASMFPFKVVTTPYTAAGGITIPAGVYMNSAFIENATITGAQIKTASIDSSHIKELTADKIRGGKITADLIESGAITVNNIDITSLRDNLNTMWVLSSPYDGDQLLERTIELGPGAYEIILYGNFYRDEAPGYYNTHTATITADIENIAGSVTTVTGTWSKKASVSADFSANTTTGQIPLAVSFIDASTGGPTSWLWNFGDGTTSSAQNPTKTYSTAGTYNVSLTATRGTGDNSYVASSDTTTKYSFISAQSVANECVLLPAVEFVLAISTNWGANETLQFNRTSGTYSWNGGDGTTSSAQLPRFDIINWTYVPETSSNFEFRVIKYTLKRPNVISYYGNPVFQIWNGTSFVTVIATSDTPQTYMFNSSWTPMTNFASVASFVPSSSNPNLSYLGYQQFYLNVIIGIRNTADSACTVYHSITLSYYYIPPEGGGGG